MKTEIIDNFLDSDLSDYLEEYFLFSVPHKYGHRSKTGGDSPFYVAYFGLNDPVISFLTYKIRKNFLNNYIPATSYINIQHKDMDGDFHTDEGADITCLYMATKTLLNGSGKFEIKNESSFEFVKNRLIMFDSKKIHKGHAPTEENQVRITLAIKMIKQNK